ncbi:MAG TPA: DUF4384 domain-containing protein [Methylibium sp.]
MKPPTPSTARRLVITAAMAVAFAGCSTLDVRQPTIEQTAAAKQGPEAAPYRSITGFSSALRCMDNLMVDYGVHDVTMLVEEIGDQTKKVNAGTRDMLITAVSDMTRRSRAVRVVAYGKDATNVISFLASAQRQSAYEVIPQYDIKGSVSQLDENVIRNQKDLGIGYQPFINIGVSRDAASSILGLDLSVLTTDDMSILPGVTSRNSVVILKQGKGFDGDAAYSKFGVNYTMNFSKSEGQSQALRGLVELAVVELAGKLTKTPYWSCLDADAQANEEISQEIADWYFAMAASRSELIGYFQNQLRQRGFYEGPIDGKFNPAIDEAIANYRAALGLSREALLDEKFFRAYLESDHAKISRPAKPASLAEMLPATTDKAAAPTLRLALTAANRQTRYAGGEPVNLTVQPTRDSHIYCYLQDENAQIRRFYPNRFNRDSLVPADQALAIPGSMRFQLVMNTKGVSETVTCFATAQDVLQMLPNSVVGVDFEALPVATLDQIRNAFFTVSGGLLAQETFHVQPK